MFADRAEVARHERLIAKNSVRLELDHYLEVLLCKAWCTTGRPPRWCEPARQEVHPVHDAWWAAVRRAHGDADGTRALIEVLLLHRSMANDHVIASP